MLTTLKDVLTAAQAGRYAMPAFDCVADLMVPTILEEADRLRSPVILMGFIDDLQGSGWTYLPPLIKTAAAQHGVPVVLHLDHVNDLNHVQRALDAGFTSVMIDGSNLPFDENVALTRAAVELAHPLGVSVEGELGHVGGMDLEAKGCEENVLTEPEEVTRFVEATGVDALAVSIGTSHGVYESLPNLHIQRLAKLRAASPVPLVLHGGSGTPDDQVRAAIAEGICKINIFADLRIAMARGLAESAAMQTREDPLPEEMFAPIRRRLAEVVRQRIELLGSQGRAAPVAVS